ncbi:hypothetical protein A4H97_18750 [Niastella yeongjuensis]|uniref:Carbohydrate-binding protein SusD n=1 Tax=Niastella yeongjuensis TaxID=354355 RepID=A0A1V9DY06_9BACT|nr:RagB/SusD family nutrient uptake outer membrane protein [Niastella yeongjuensis]OQP38758.1 hypothetical protein A4H97_18750 [Niastella yeongjuensis]SEO33704.1 Starch-binding associating with outer membrane [Niastella yeongjuensis]
MKNIKNISYAVAAFLVTAAASCNKQLDEVNPHSATVETAYTTPTGFTGLVNRAYQDLHQIYGIEDGMFLTEAGTDLWFNDSRGTYAQQYTQYVGLAPGQAQGKNHWTACYRGIYYCNVGLHVVDGANFTNQTEKNQRLGELRFLRALYYYHIVEQYGAATLDTTYKQGAIITEKLRTAPEDIYAVMIDDLEFAKANLPLKWADAEYSRASKKSAMGLYAKVLLTRAYYATGADRTAWFTKAKAAAEDVINNRGALNLDLYPNFAQVGASMYGTTRSQNTEAMFVLAYSEANNTLNAYTTTNGNRIFKWTIPKYTQRPGMSTSYVYGADNEQRLMPTWHLLDLFNEDIDARYNACFQEVWIANQAWAWKGNLDNSKLKYQKAASATDSVIAVGDTAMYFTKKVWGGRLTRRYMEIDRNELYKNPQPGKGASLQDDKVYVTSCYPGFKKFLNPNITNTTRTTDYGDAMIMRYAEMLLIAAEASVQLGDQATAMKYVNDVRKRAAIPTHEADMEITDPSKVDINFILDERGREFAGEQMRWYDLKRVFRSGVDWVAYILKYNPDMTSIQPFHRDRPIPLAELQTLSNPVQYGQNIGYDQPK